MSFPDKDSLHKTAKSSVKHTLLGSANNLVEEDDKLHSEKVNMTSGRYYLIVFAVFLVLIVYVVLYWVQFFSAYHFKGKDIDIRQETAKRIERTVRIEEPRGKILDVNGKILALSMPLQTFQLDVKVFMESKANLYDDPNSPKLAALCQALDLDFEEIRKKILDKPNSRYLGLKRYVSPTITQYLRKLNIPGLSSYTEYRRFYPYGEATAQLVGLTDSDGNGIFGVERLANNSLRATNGTMTYEHNFKREVIRYKDFRPSQKPKDIRLTIDINLQNAAYQALVDNLAVTQADSASAILVDLQTSRILAMVNAASFNPNDRKTATEDVTRNQAISNVFEPGSTVKPFVVYAGLKNKVVNTTTPIYTAEAKIGKRSYRDPYSRTNEKTIQEILKVSSNVGVINISQRLPADELRKTYLSVGFGVPTGLGLAGESSGVFPFDKKMTELDRAIFSFGYLQLVSPLQLVHAYTTLGTYGIYRPLSIIYDENVPAGEQVLDREAAKTVVDLMVAVSQRGGTATRAAVPNYNISVKTGTAKKTEVKTFTNSEGKEYKKSVYVDKYIAYTAGVAPSSNPRFALVVVVDNAKGAVQGGGAVASPVFKKIMQSALSYYNVPEDNSKNQIIITTSNNN